MQDTEILYEAASEYRKEGLNVIPCSNEKRPVGSWTEFQDKLLSPEEFRQRLNGSAYGVGILCGKGSGNLEVIDIDAKYDLRKNIQDENLIAKYFQIISEYDQALLDQLRVIETPTNGLHLYYRCELIGRNQKLARRHATDEELKLKPDEKIKVLIETRGQGGFIVAPPTSGYSIWWKHDIPTITIEQRNFLLEAARSLNEVYEQFERKPANEFTGESPFETTPWEDYNDRGDIIPILEKHGWQIEKESGLRVFLTRPGKHKGYSADYHKDIKLFKCWSTSVSEFHSERAYNHTAVYALLEHNGDFSEASKALEELGYGIRKLKEEGPTNYNSTTHQASQSKQAEDYKELFIQSLLDQLKVYPAPVPVINLVYNDEVYPVLTRKSFSLWQGKQKSKKTITLALMVAAFIQAQTCEDSIYFEGKGEGKVLWFDCEQGESFAARTMRLMLKLAGRETSDRLKYSDLREFTPRQRLNLIKAGLEVVPDVRLIIIDGLVDLTEDFTEPGEAHYLITEILRLCSAYDLHIAGVLHQNKQDKNARHHIGTISSQKCEMEISTEVDPDDRSRSIVTCVNPRGLPFEPFAVRWDKGSLPRIDNSWNNAVAGLTDVKSVKKYEQSKDIVQSVFKPFTAHTHAEAIDLLMEATRKSKSAVKRYMDDYIGWGLIEKGDDGRYRQKMKEGSRVQVGSFVGS